MLDSLYIGASGMHVQQMNIDVVANNLANVNTAGFKKSRVDFEDLLYRNMAQVNGVAQSPDSQSRIGAGAGIAATGKIYTPGEIKKTDGQFDLAIQGNGFFEVMLPDGTPGYTRNGAFKVDADGMLVNSDGYRLSADIQIPSEMTAITVDATGHVRGTVAGDTKATDIGQIEIASFANQAGLNPIGNNIAVASDKSGDVVMSAPGEQGAGTISQGFIESSNVQLTDEMINLILAQRAYEINSKVVQASDEMLTIANGLYR